MQVTETLSEGLKREYKIVVGADDIEGRMSTRLSELSKEVKMPGFRPGKVPVSLLRKTYGKQVLGEILESHGQRMLGAIGGLVQRLRPDLDVEARRLHVFSLLGQCVFYAHARPILDRQFGPKSYRSDRIPELAEHIANVFLKGVARTGTQAGGTTP